MSNFRTVCKVGDVLEGEGQCVEVDGKLIGIFREKGQYYAISDVCPHMGASLSGGMVENGVVTCPWHGWRFRLCDGAWADYTRVKIDTYPVRVAGDEIQVAVPPKAPAPKKEG